MCRFMSACLLIFDSCAKITAQVFYLVTFAKTIHTTDSYAKGNYDFNKIGLVFAFNGGTHLAHLAHVNVIKLLLMTVLNWVDTYVTL